jgi:hypothetical protein
MGALLPAEHRFRRAGIEQQFLPPAGSFLGNVFRKHGGAGAPELDVETYISHVNAARTVLQMRSKSSTCEANSNGRSSSWLSRRWGWNRAPQSSTAATST